MSKQFRWSMRVYYEDTDTAGVVYHANYLKFMERARTEWLRSLGIEQDALIAEHNVVFAVTRVEADFRRPARFNQMLVVTVRLTERRRASFLFEQEVRGHEDDVLYCSGTIRVVCLDAEQFRPRPLPGRLLTEIIDEL